MHRHYRICRRDVHNVSNRFDYPIISKLHKDLTAIDANKRHQNQRARSRKRIHLTITLNSIVNSGDSRLTSIRGANSAKRPECTFRMEDYLETIYELVQHKGYAPLADVA
ncbi:MAG: hypothetical protein M3M91_03505, partial [Thermoproteota archaeon]|nr:hypothetical protein [Thermoproteota archaeon]